MRKYLLVIGFVLLFAFEILRVYFIMPFPGSQKADTIGIAYFIGRNIFWLRLLALLLLAYPFYYTLKHGKLWGKVTVIALAALFLFIFYKFNFVFEADKMFYQPKHKNFAAGANDTTKKDKLVIGVAINGEAKAYPIQIIGYHHQVVDTIDKTLVIVTYCTVCRTGRAYSPLVNGKPETFRLVGMDHFNAMFEDATTKSWWQQATGVAIAGPLKGTSLQEIPSQQMTLAAWLRQYPSSKILQPDTLFKGEYKDMTTYDKGTSKGKLTKRDSASWKMKSWVVGVFQGKDSKAYDWNELVKTGIIQDSIAGKPVVIVLEKDSATFHVWSGMIGSRKLSFTYDALAGALTEGNTHSTWNMNGDCIDGSMTGLHLQSLHAY